MVFKIFSAIVAAGLLLAYLLPVAIKLKEISLTIVVLIGLGLMAWDLWGSFHEKDE
jgi:cytosine/uracil/thiamine/allantoin permease